MSFSETININNISETSYGELITAEPTAYVSGSPTYGFRPANFREFTVGTGSLSIANNEFTVNSGTSFLDYGVLRSFRSLNYKAGQAAVVRLGARFGTPQANTQSGAGAFNLGDEISFGYSGTDFGIWHRYNGKAEVRTIQVTGAAGAATNLTLTLNSVVYTIPLTNSTVQQNALEIANYLNANATELEAEQVNDSVIIDYLSDGAKSGTYSFSHATATGTITQNQVGVTKTSEHIIQANWNGSLYDGFDPTKGQCYKFEYIGGYGNIRCFVLNPNTSRYDLVHTIMNLNNNTLPNFLNPSLHIGAYAYQVANPTGTAVEVNLAYISGFVHGQISRTRNPRGTSNTKSIGTTSTPIFSLRCSRTYSNTNNQVEIDPTYLTLANDGTKSAVFSLYTTPDASNITGYDFRNIGTNLISDVSTAGTAHTATRLIATFTVAKGQSISVNLKEFEIRIPPGLILIIAGRMASGSASDLSATLSWYEDI